MTCKLTKCTMRKRFFVWFCYILYSSDRNLTAPSGYKADTVTPEKLRKTVSCLTIFPTSRMDVRLLHIWKAGFNPNTMKSYKILQKLSPKHAAHGVAQSTYPYYRHGKTCLSKQPPWRAAWDPRLVRGRFRVRAPGPAGALRALFSSTLPSFLLRETVFFRTFPTNPAKVLGLLDILLAWCIITLTL